MDHVTWTINKDVLQICKSINYTSCNSINSEKKEINNKNVIHTTLTDQAKGQFD